MAVGNMQAYHLKQVQTTEVRRHSEELLYIPEALCFSLLLCASLSVLVLVRLFRLMCACMTYC